MIFAKLRKAFKLVKSQDDEARLSATLTDDPISIEMIRRIARDYDYHFEIVQRDGTILKFKKAGVSLAVDRDQGDVW